MFKLVSKINAWMRGSFEHKVSNNDLNLQLCGKSHSFGHEHKRDNTFSLFSSLSQCSALTFYPPSLEWHEWFLSTLELLSRGNLECLRFGASIAWMRHLLFMASLVLLFFHSGFVVEDRLEPTSHIHDILGSSTKNKTTGQQQNKKGLLESLDTIHGILVRPSRIDFFWKIICSSGKVHFWIWFIFITKKHSLAVRSA